MNTIKESNKVFGVFYVFVEVFVVVEVFPRSDGRDVFKLGCGGPASLFVGIVLVSMSLLLHAEAVNDYTCYDNSCDHADDHTNDQSYLGVGRGRVGRSFRIFWRWHVRREDLNAAERWTNRKCLLVVLQSALQGGLWWRTHSPFHFHWSARYPPDLNELQLLWCAHWVILYQRSQPTFELFHLRREVCQIQVQQHRKIELILWDARPRSCQTVSRPTACAIRIPLMTGFAVIAAF